MEKIAALVVLATLFVAGIIVIFLLEGYGSLHLSRGSSSGSGANQSGSLRLPIYAPISQGGQLVAETPSPMSTRFHTINDVSGGGFIAPTVPKAQPIPTVMQTPPNLAPANPAPPSLNPQPYFTPYVPGALQSPSVSASPQRPASTPVPWPSPPRSPSPSPTATAAPASALPTP